MEYRSNLERGRWVHPLRPRDRHVRRDANAATIAIDLLNVVDRRQNVADLSFGGILLKVLAPIIENLEAHELALRCHAGDRRAELCRLARAIIFWAEPLAGLHGDRSRRGSYSFERYSAKRQRGGEPPPLVVDNAGLSHSWPVAPYCFPCSGKRRERIPAGKAPRNPASSLSICMVCLEVPPLSDKNAAQVLLKPSVI